MLRHVFVRFFLLSLPFYAILTAQFGSEVISMRRRRHTTYEYESHEPSIYKQKIRHSPRLKALDRLLFCLVIPLPLLGFVLQAVSVPIPAVLLTAYTAVAQTVAGLLFIVLTACNVGGFGKVGFFFTHTRGKRWMSTAEAKTNTFLFGFIMLVIGVMAGLWTIKML